MMEEKQALEVQKVQNGYIVYMNRERHETLVKVFLDVNEVMAYVTEIITGGA